MWGRMKNHKVHHHEIPKRNCIIIVNIVLTQKILIICNIRQSSIWNGKWKLKINVDFQICYVLCCL